MSTPSPDGGPLMEHVELLLSFTNPKAADQAVSSLTELNISAAPSQQAARPDDGVLIDVIAPAWQVNQVKRVAQGYEPDIDQSSVG